MTRQRWELPDGDFLDVDLGPDPGPDAPVALVLHGLEGSSKRRYVLSACTELAARGVRPVALNFRGCSGVPNRLPRFYHSGETGDAALCLGRLRKMHPGRRIGAWGFSLGGNVLLKLLGERRAAAGTLVDAAVALSVPFDLGAGASLLEQTVMGRAYAAYFLRSLRRKLRAKGSLLEGFIDVEAALRARTLRDFDEVATAPLHGFESADDYYAQCSSGGFLEGVEVRTLVLQSIDDPFLPKSALPRERLSENAHLVDRITSLGGHVGYLEGPPWAPRFWGEREGAAFLAAELGATRQG